MKDHFGLAYIAGILLPSGESYSFGPVLNLVPDEGRDYIDGLILGGTQPVSGWYMGVFEGNYVPTPATKAADLPGVVGECTAYAELTRPAWQASSVGGVLTNADNKAVITMTADKVLRGAFIVSSDVRGGNGGVLLSIARFPTPHPVPAGTQFSFTGLLPTLNPAL